METAASNDEALLISPSNGPARKKFRARKTMTASCRQQLATLKQKNSSNGETTNESENSLKEAPIKTVQEPEIICETNFTAEHSPAPGNNKSQGVFHNGLKVSIEVSQVDSGINIGCSYNETWEGVSKQSEDVPFSHTAHFLVQDFNADATENHITAIQQVTACTNTESQSFSEDVKSEGGQTGATCNAISENLNASITVKIIEEDKSLKTTSSIDVTPAEPPDPDSSPVPNKELDPSNCTVDDSSAPTSPPTFDTVSVLVQPTPESDAAADESGLGGGCQKKRTCSESSHVPDSKRAKTSTNTLLDEIQCLIDRRVNKIFEDAFEQRLQALTRQTNLIRKHRNHTDEITRHLRSIRRLERHLKYAVNLQTSTCSTNVAPISSSSDELCSTVAASSTPTVLPPTEAAESVPRTPPAPDATASSTDLVVLSDNESEQPSNPKQLQKGHPNNSSKNVDNAAMQKIMESIKEHRKKAHSSRTNKAAKNVIDLTDDEGQKSDKDSALVSEPCTPNGDLSAPVTLSQENGSVESVFDKHSVEKEPPSSDRNEASSSDGNENRQSATTPISTTSEKPPEAVTALQTSSTPEPTGLKPPQKPHLRLAQVQNPKGIALSWNVTSVDRSCAPAKVYCLYVHQGDPNNPKKLWKKIGEIKALPLPMACTLTQFVDDTTYSFAMRAKDAGGRFGPLCDIQSTTLKPASSSKKS